MRKTILTLSFLAAFLFWSAPAVFAGALFPYAGIDGVSLAPPAPPSIAGPGVLSPFPPVPPSGVVVTAPLPGPATFTLGHYYYDVERTGVGAIIIQWNSIRYFTVPAGAGATPTSVLTAGSVPIDVPAGGGGTFDVEASVNNTPANGGGLLIGGPGSTADFETPLVTGTTAWGPISASGAGLVAGTYRLIMTGKVVWTDSALGSVLSVGVPAGGGTSNYIARAGDAVPEPCTMLLLGTGLAGFAGRYLRRRKDVVQS
ncbi:MAG TPA: PEP-CTERM sorting domain-containing protein [Candidatus Hypogeohydataceae bacterium YC41]